MNKSKTKNSTKKVAKKVTTKKCEVQDNCGVEILEHLIAQAKERDQQLKDNAYTVYVNFNNSDFKAEAETMEDAFEAIYALKPFFLKTKVVIKIQKDGKQAEKAIPPMLARRLFKLPKSMKAMITRLIFK